MDTVFVTGDTHRDFSHIRYFCMKHQTTVNDIMIVLGDAGINYFGDHRDEEFKRSLSRLPITFFCIHGNHESRPGKEVGYELVEFHGDKAYIQSEYPNIVFAKDGSVYDFVGHQCLVCGGAYSVDKDYRLRRGYRWFADEQPNEQIKEQVETRLSALGNKIDIILTHTCPQKYIPTEVFLPGIDQSTVDTSTEEWLNKIEERTLYDRWYCGHYHTNKTIDKMRFLYEDIVAISPNVQTPQNG